MKVLVLLPLLILLTTTTTTGAPCSAYIMGQQNPSDTSFFTGSYSARDGIVDLNGDGVVDVYRRSGSNLQIALNTGSGTIPAFSSVTPGPGAFVRDIVHGNADGDADANDLIVITPSTIVVYENNGNADFTQEAPQAIPFPGMFSSPDPVVGGYLSGNGASIDLICSEDDLGIFVLLNDGDGTYSSGFVVYDAFSSPTPSGFAVKEMAVGDLTGDGNGDDDIVLSADGTLLAPTVFLFINTNSGTSWSAPIIITTLPSLAEIVLADVTMDSRLDLIVATTNTLSFFPNTGNLTVTGVFGPQTSITGALSSPVDVAVGDVNHDSFPDVVVRNNADLFVLPSAGAPPFFRTAPLNFDQVFSVVHVFVAKADNAGPGDNVVVLASNNFYVFPSIPSALVFGTDILYPSGYVASGHLNGDDTTLDFVRPFTRTPVGVGSLDEYTVQIQLGGSPNPVTIPAWIEENEISFVTTADANLDGIDDVFFYVDGTGGGPGSNPLAGFFLSPSFTQTSIVFTTPLSPPVVPVGNPYLMDVTGLGAMDVLVLGTGSADVFINMGISSPWARIHRAGINPGAIGFGDGDGDGVYELIEQISVDNTVVIRVFESLNPPTLGGPGTEIVVDSPVPLAGITFANVDSAGYADIVASQAANGILIYLSTGLWTYGTGTVVVPGEPPSFVWGASDVTRDSGDEIIFGSRLLVNRYPIDPNTVALPSTPIYARDVNGDDYVDFGFAARVRPISPMLSSRRSPPRVIRAPGTATALSLLVRTLESTSSCFVQTLVVPDDTVMKKECSGVDPWVIPPDASWILQGCPGCTTLDCGPNGGVLFDVQGSLDVRGLGFANTSVGTGLTAASAVRVSGTLVLTNVTLSGCDSTGSQPTQSYSGLGGCVSVVDAGVMEATGSTFSNSRARVAGGCLSLGGSSSFVHLSDVTLSGCRAPEGGGLAVLGTGSRLVMEGGEVVGNVAETTGGGLVISSTSGGSRVTLAGVNVSSNYAGHSGGGIGIDSVTSGSGTTHVVIESGWMEGNSAGLVGGGMSVQSNDVDVLVADVAFSGRAPNTAPYGGLAGVAHASYVWPSSTRASDVPTWSGGSGPVPRVSFAGDVTSHLGGGSSSTLWAGFMFVCGGQVDMGPNPGVGAGSVLLCLDGAGHLPVESSGWITGGTSGLVRTTPPVELVALADTFPPVVMSGQGLESGVMDVLDAYSVRIGRRMEGTGLGVRLGSGNSEVDGYALVARPEGQSPVFDREGRVVMVGVGGAAPVSAWALSSPESQVPVRLVVSLEVGAESNAFAPFSNLDLAVGQCQVGFGRVSTNDSNLALICGACVDAFVSDTLSTSPCLPIPECPDFSARSVPNGLCECLRGAFSLNGDGVVPCGACPVGGVCLGGASGPTAAPGYFPSGQSGSFARCPRPEGCAGNGLCQKGYRGRLCAVCDQRYYVLNGKCVACESGREAVIISLVVCGALVVGFVLLCFNLTEGLRYRFVAAVIGLEALQIAALYGQLDLPWGRVARVYLDVASAMNLNLELTSPECSLSAGADAWVFRWAMSLLFPVLALCVLLVCAGVVAVLIVGSVGWFGDKNMAELGSALVRTEAQVISLMYLALASASLAPFGCEKDGTGSYRMSVDPGRSCYDDGWLSGLLPVGIVAVCVYVIGIPSGVVWVLWTRKQRLDEVTFVLRFGFLVGRFRQRAWYFEAIVMMRKAVVVMAMTFGPSASKPSTLVVVLVACLVHLGVVQPYISAFHNGLAVVVLGATTLVLFAGTVEDKTRRSVGIGIGLCVNVLGIVVGNAVDVWLVGKGEAAVEESEFFGAGLFKMAREGRGPRGDGGLEKASSMEYGVQLNVLEEGGGSGIVGGGRGDDDLSSLI